MNAYRRSSRRHVSLGEYSMVPRREQSLRVDVRGLNWLDLHRSEAEVAFAPGVAVAGQGAQCSAGPSRRTPNFALMVFNRCSCLSTRLLTVMMIPEPLPVLVVEL